MRAALQRSCISFCVSGVFATRGSRDELNNMMMTNALRHAPTAARPQHPGKAIPQAWPRTHRAGYRAALRPMAIKPVLAAAAAPQVRMHPTLAPHPCCRCRCAADGISCNGCWRALQTLDRPAVEAQTHSPRLDAAIAEFAALVDPQDRLKLLLEYGKRLKPMAAEAKTDANHVMGCTAQVGVKQRASTDRYPIGARTPSPFNRCTQQLPAPRSQLNTSASCSSCGSASAQPFPVPQAWIDARLDADGRVQLTGDSDSALTRGLAAVLVHALSGLTPEEVLDIEPSSLAGLVSAHVPSWLDPPVSRRPCAFVVCIGS